MYISHFPKKSNIEKQEKATGIVLPYTEYEWQIRKIWDLQNISAWVPGTRFITLVFPCNAPIGLFVNNITVNMAAPGWNEREGSFSVQYKNIDSLNWTITLTEDTNVVFLAGLEENTTIEVTRAFD